MAPFRRPGLQDDEAESQPDMLRPRPPPSHQHAPSQSFPGDEDSVVSGLSAMSDLESLYVESSSRKHLTARDQYLLAQKLPGQAAPIKGSGLANALNPFAAENDDGEDNWEDMVYAATLQQSYKPQVAPKQQQAIDPAEQERLDLNRAITASRLLHEEEQMRLAQIVEDEEETPHEGEKTRKSPPKNSKKKVKKKLEGKNEKTKKKGLWSALTGKKNPKR